ncbi:MAG TPA: cytosine permease, partial [Amphiplicatus sp.]|nr:cytosine permease [Amphiplicatus sp.]
MAVRQANPDALFSEGPRTMSLGLAISAVAGGIMAGAATMPDLTRYAKSRKGAVIAMFVAYGLGAPLILACAAIPSLVTGEKDLMQIILGLGLGVPALFVLIFSTWTSNAANLYSAGLSLAATFKRIRPWRLTLSAGILGIVVALSGIIDFFVPFLISLGVLIPPIAAIYVVDFLFVVRRRYDLKDIDTRPAFRWQAFVSWIAGSAVGFATAKGLLTLTTISACDALIVSGGVFYLLERYGPRAD